MRHYRQFIVASTIAFCLCAAGLASAQEADRCIDSLRLAGMDRLRVIGESDAEAYMADRACSEETTTHGMNTQFLWATMNGNSQGKFDQAKRSCSSRQEASRNSSYSYRYVDTVVREALTSWNDCMRFHKAGIDVRLESVATPFVKLRFARNNLGPGMVRGVRVRDDGAGMTCSGQLVRKNEPAVLKENMDERFEYELTYTEPLLITCERKAIASSETVGAKIYPRAVLSIDTSDTSYNLTLPAEPIATEVWASEIQKSIDGLRAELGKKLDNDAWPTGSYVILAGSEGCPTGFEQVNASLTSIVTYMNENDPATGQERR